MSVAAGGVAAADDGGVWERPGEAGWLCVLPAPAIVAVCVVRVAMLEKKTLMDVTRGWVVDAGGRSE